ncbi:MAG TPA: VWA domain-containing protein [Xanthomonadales bacterium]|nr:VWA domain-containing protein [Xanthomonadales bacterium]
MTDLSLFHFLRPGWLWFLPLVVLIPWLWRRLRRPSGDWARVCDPHLLKWLSVGSNSSGPGKTGSLLAGLGLLLGILALAGPSWVKLPDASFTARDARVIALDLSNSMLAGDLRPDRLTQARYRLADLLNETTEGQVGVVAFAGDAFVVSPLTSDMNTIANLLPALQPDIIPVAGSRADLGLELAATLLERAGIALGEVLLVTDSADGRTAAAARQLRDKGILVSVLAVGTPEGAPIPQGGGFLLDGSGSVVIARVDNDALRTVAAAGGGRFSALSIAGNQIEPWLDQDSKAFERREDALEERWQDAGPWLVLLLIPVLLTGFRRGLLFTLALGFLPMMLPTSAHAGWWEDLWQRKDQQAWQALQQEQPDLAAALAVDPALAGEGSYRAGDYESASRSWTRLEGADAWYNRGNALALQGDFDNAIAAYDNALQIEPDMNDAIYNKNVIEQMKQEQEQQQQGDGEGEQEQPQDQESEPSDQSEGEQQEGEQQQGEQEGESEPEEAEGEREAERLQKEIQEAWSEEDAQAMEQWLRRIPDDPGGLLRRKFRNEYLRRGEQESEEKTW